MRYFFFITAIIICSASLHAQYINEYELKQSEQNFTELPDAKNSYLSFCNNIRGAHQLNNSNPDSASVLYEQAQSIAGLTKKQSLQNRLKLDRALHAVLTGDIEMTDSLTGPMNTVQWDKENYLLHFFYLRIQAYSNKTKGKLKLALAQALAAQKLLDDNISRETDKNILAIAELGQVNIKSDLSNLYKDTKQNDKSLVLKKENLDKILSWDDAFLASVDKKQSDKDLYLANAYNNLAVTRTSQNNWSGYTGRDSLIEDYLDKAILLSTKINNQSFLFRIYYNYAKYYKSREDWTNRGIYLEKALSIGLKIGEKTGILTCYYELAQNLLITKRNPAKALELASKALEMARNIPSLGTKGDIYLTYCKALNANGRSGEALVYYDSADNYKAEELKSTFDQEITEMQTKYETAEKEKAIIEKDSQIKQEKAQMVLLYIGVIAIGIIALISFVSFMQKRRSHRIIEHEKNRSESLLLNILPEETAAELKASGHAEARHYDNCTVMFTDFKDFTKVSEKLSPKELVAEIDYCFSEFDRIISKFNIEKIKTIGDSYMCVANLPKANPNHAFEMVCAALEINTFIKKIHAERAAQGIESFQIRIGLHTGPLVAGVVGTKKFAYDVWGDTVNTASRMESSGEPGMVNISGSTYELIKHQFHCDYRGKVKAKNKGEIDMYFVSYIDNVSLQ